MQGYLGIPNFGDIFPDAEVSEVPMSSPKKPIFRSAEELERISTQWREDKKTVDEKLGRVYQRDLDHECGKYLSTKDLRALFRHASYLYHGGVVENSLLLYPSEPQLITKVYREILEHGYYSRSTEEEKRVRAHFGKAVSRQTRPRGK
jgi:hypothetical protein